MLVNEINGFSLFNDVEDKALQAFNRGRVMTNILLDHKKNTAKGGFLSLTYMKQIPVEERQAAIDAFMAEMAKEGFILKKEAVIGGE
jgi:hypothetical protein